MRIAVFLRSLDTGGAERQLVQVAGGLADRGHDVRLVTRFPGGALSHLLSPRVGRTVLCDRPRGRLGRALELARAPARLRAALEELAPDVVYTALYVNDALAHRALRGSATPLVWGFRNADQPLSWLRARAMRYTRAHAGEVALAISNSQAAAEFLRHAGFRLPELRVIPNGVDTHAFRPAPSEGGALRAELGLASEAFVVGCVGRLHPMKDHETFLRAAALFARQTPEARFVCAGAGEHAYALRLRRRAQELGLAPLLSWTGERQDMRALYNACDLIASTSVAEGFPNALVEALACERPCVATDVGDCALALGNEGTLVPPRDPQAQAEAWSRARALPPAERGRIGAQARARVARELSLEACTARTEEALQDALGRRRG